MSKAPPDRWVIQGRLPQLLARPAAMRRKQPLGGVDTSVDDRHRALGTEPPRSEPGTREGSTPSSA
jgi:hypothetical protein